MLVVVVVVVVVCNTRLSGPGWLSQYSDSLLTGRSGDWIRRPQWPSCPRPGSAAACLLALRVRMPPGTWAFVLCWLYSKDKGRKTGQRGTDKVQWEKKKKIPVGARSFAPIQPGSGTHPTSQTMGISFLSRGLTTHRHVPPRLKKE